MATDDSTPLFYPSFFFLRLVFLKPFKKLRSPVFTLVFSQRLIRDFSQTSRTSKASTPRMLFVCRIGMHSKSKLFTSWSQVLLSLFLLKAPLCISLGSTDQWGMGGLGPLHCCWAYASSQPGIYGEFIKAPWLFCLLWLYKISPFHESIACHKRDHSLTLVEPLALPVLLQLKVTILIKISKCSLISRDSKTPAFQGLPHPGWNATPIKLGMRKREEE